MLRIKQSILIILSLAGMIWLGYKISQMTTHDENYRINATTFDSLLTNIHWVEFDEKGNIAQEFYSPLVKNDPKTNLYHIMKPLLKLTQDSEFWEIQSNYADASQTNDQIELKENVLIKHITPKHPEMSTMKTDHLSYHPKLKKADTNDKVTITMGENILQSQGLEASFEDNKKIKLGSVTGHYQPNKQQEKG
jgi:lipopolysaccharide export system protein LptC